MTVRLYNKNFHQIASIPGDDIGELIGQLTISVDGENGQPNRIYRIDSVTTTTPHNWAKPAEPGKAIEQ